MTTPSLRKSGASRGPMHFFGVRPVVVSAPTDPLFHSRFFPVDDSKRPVQRPVFGHWSPVFFIPSSVPIFFLLTVSPQAVSYSSNGFFT